MILLISYPIQRPSVKLNPFLILAAALLTFCADTFSLPLDPLLNSDSLWEMSPESFMEAGQPNGFEWTSATKDSARTAGKDLTFLGQVVVECVARFKEGKPSQITAIFYARGDSGDLKEEDYNTLVRQGSEAVNQFTQTSFKVRGKDPSNAVRAEGLVWTTPSKIYLLEYSKVREVKSMRIPFRAEFVRLKITPPLGDLDLSQQIQAEPSEKFFGPKHVVRDESNGDVRIADIPMVDQGQKGYCVVAASERVMRDFWAVR